MAHEMHGEEELGMYGLANESQSSLLQRPIPLEEIAAEAGRHHVGPGGLAAPRARHDVIHGELLAAPAAVLAGVTVATQDVFLVEGDSLEEGFTDVGGEPDHRRQRKDPGRRTDD